MSRSFPLGPWVVIASLALVVLAGGSVFFTLARAADAQHLVSHTFQVRQVAGDLFSAIQEAESGQRGYILTGKPSYLAPYRGAAASVPRNFQRLRKLTSDNPLQQHRLAELQPLVAQRLGLMGETNMLVGQNRRDEAVAVVDSGQGQALMNRIRALVSAFSQTELDLLQTREAALATLQKRLFGLALLSLVLAIVLVALLGRGMLKALAAARQHASELDAEIQARARTEERLRQAQRLEAVGRLAGGIAHDFNNLIMIGKGNLSLLKRRSEALPVKAAAYMAGIDFALTRAADLTGRILAFSRRQELSPRLIQVSAVIGEMGELVRHTLREGITLDLQLNSQWWTTCDPGQLENVVLNLINNARDAMPDGGRLTISTGDCFVSTPPVEDAGFIPGDYVVLRVDDTGEGMSEEVRSRALEPFFTTKPFGSGTGLGLSMVFGYVRQSAGYMKLDSEPGKGSVVTIYLPRQGAPDSSRELSGEAENPLKVSA